MIHFISQVLSWFNENISPILCGISIVLIPICLVLLIPSKTRRYSCYGMITCSWLVGISTYIYAILFLFLNFEFGWIVLAVFFCTLLRSIGMFGISVVMMFWKGAWESGLFTLIGIGVPWLCSFLGFYILEKKLDKQKFSKKSV